MKTGCTRQDNAYFKQCIKNIRILEDLYLQDMSCEMVKWWLQFWYQELNNLTSVNE
jgi:hypothetical protein